MSNAFIQLRHFAAQIEVGVTERTECPWCGGGDSNEKAFAITRTSEAESQYICFRASCGRKGRLTCWGFQLRQIADNSTEKGQSFTPRLHSAGTQQLGEEWTAELLDLYDIRKEEADWAGWRVEADSGNLVIPVRSPTGISRGVEVRRSKNQVPIVGGPKTAPYRVLDEPWLGWYRGINTGSVVLVEDAISALKVSRKYQTCCLHGSYVSLDMLLEVLTQTGVHDEIIIALDKDATEKALKFIVEWRFLAPNFRAVCLSKDLKYSSDEEIVRIITR